MPNSLPAKSDNASNASPLGTTGKLAVETPTIQRRLVSLVYDFVLLAAVSLFGLSIYVLLLRSLGPDFHAIGRPLMFIAVTALYLIHSWTGSGHTLAMKTWRIKIVKVGSATVPVKAALVRYIAGWGWVLPGLVAIKLLGLPPKLWALPIAVNVVLWGLTALLDRDRQFLHDRLAGTRLIALPKLPKGALLT